MVCFIITIKAINQHYPHCYIKKHLFSIKLNNQCISEQTKQQTGFQTANKQNCKKQNKTLVFADVTVGVTM